MDSSQLFGVTMMAYILAAAFYLGLFLFKSKRMGLIGLLLAIGGLLVQTVAIGLRWHESYQMGVGHAPLTNMYESLIFFAWCTTLFYLGLEFRFKTRVMGAFVMPCVAMAMAYASLSDRIDDQISPLIPALQSNWLIAHVVTCFIGYGAFVVAGGLGMMYLLKQSVSNTPQKASLFDALPALKVIDDLTHKTIVFGFIWLTAGIITGAIWANEAWGTYWSWDPKETWSIITWFLYASTLHARFTRGWRGRRIAWLAILGLFAVFFTYFGVNFLLSGLHSYGSV
ncbi:cytochrome c-type biogenesis protein CcsB [Desulfobulbus propionicus DSM 2032]|jgi:cytochrome c-type biogenesis protein CcsB|uniref:Heme exporter protein C n=1 Tax=Desulfobulbus propionicus (strain ATCC 33891 / DSM 2032 / VKM B-1956 / 1pr3) TaxID=577650 RepID=A0A7U4DPI5_DESPD|nr:c-type cytochrome biogenesis protein CcsB [Desulfobulbus propionicus]ADW18114.1 cytochrome c-type biogenesis protein CcsB [Desulfobulbus propionicus DSM 2032]